MRQLTQGVNSLELSINILSSGQAVSAIRAAMDDYTRMTCISFRQRTMADSDYVRFFAGSG